MAPGELKLAVEAGREAYLLAGLGRRCKRRPSESAPRAD